MEKANERLSNISYLQKVTRIVMLELTKLNKQVEQQSKLYKRLYLFCKRQQPTGLPNPVYSRPQTQQPLSEQNWFAARTRPEKQRKDRKNIAEMIWRKQSCQKYRMKDSSKVSSCKAKLSTTLEGFKTNVRCGSWIQTSTGKHQHPVEVKPH